MFGQLIPSKASDWKFALDEKDLESRAMKMLQLSRDIFQIQPVIVPQSIVSENEKMNTLFVAQIFNLNTGLKLKEEEKQEIVQFIQLDEESREDRGKIIE